jgi:metallo-beta-lactamase class B
MRITTLLLLLLSTFAAAAQTTPRAWQAWNEPVEPFRIAGNLYYVGASDLTSFLIATPKGHILIDGGMEETAPLILASIRKLGFDPKDVRILLSSHAHADHAGGRAALAKATGATFYSSAGDVALHARGGLDDPQFGDKLPYPPIVADRVVADGQQISLGGTTVVAHITPGHTPGCTTWTTRVREKARMLDTIFVCSVTAPDYKLIGNRRYPDAVADYRKSFQLLRSLPVDIFLASHGAFFNLKEKMQSRDFVDPEMYRAYIDRNEKTFESLVAQQSK